MTDPVPFRHTDAGTDESRWLGDPRWALAPVLDVPALAAKHDELLVLAAHPDDETLGAGGLVAMAARAGMPVRVVVATDGEGSHPDASVWDPERLARCGGTKGPLPSPPSRPARSCGTSGSPTGRWPVGATSSTPRWTGSSARAPSSSRRGAGTATRTTTPSGPRRTRPPDGAVRRCCSTRCGCGTGRLPTSCRGPGPTSSSSTGPRTTGGPPRCASTARSRPRSGRPRGTSRCSRRRCCAGPPARSSCSSATDARCRSSRERRGRRPSTRCTTGARTPGASTARSTSGASAT